VRHQDLLDAIVAALGPAGPPKSMPM
jgi:hypothetical protein